jgi:hypothetical protein
MDMTSKTECFLLLNELFLQGQLAQCQLSLIGDEVLITCPDQSVFKELFVNNKDLQSSAQQVNIGRITLIFESDKHSIPVGQKLQLNPRVTTLRGIELYQLLYSFDGEAKALRMLDSSSIASNGKTEKTSGVKPLDWLKMRNSDYWIPEHLSNFTGRLMSDVAIKNYEYTAFLVNYQKCKFNVDAQLFLFEGELIRVVKCNSVEPV